MNFENPEKCEVLFKDKVLVCQYPVVSGAHVVQLDADKNVIMDERRGIPVYEPENKGKIRQKKTKAWMIRDQDLDKSRYMTQEDMEKAWGRGATKRFLKNWRQSLGV